MKHGDIKLPTPCHADWRTMTPSGGGRFCGDCKKVVRDLSRMTERDARALLRETKNTELCVRYLYDRDGKVVFTGDAPSPMPATALLSRVRRAATAAAIAAPLALAACSAHPGQGASSSSTEQQPRSDDDSQYTENMGGVPYDPSYDQTDAAADAAGDADAAPDAPTATTDDADTDGGPRHN